MSCSGKKIQPIGSWRIENARGVAFFIATDVLSIDEQGQCRVVDAAGSVEKVNVRGRIDGDRFCADLPQDFQLIATAEGLDDRKDRLFGIVLPPRTVTDETGVWVAEIQGK